MNNATHTRIEISHNSIERINNIHCPSTYEANTSLRQSCIDIIDRYIQCHNKNICPTTQSTLFNKIYDYSIKTGKLDSQFAYWLLSRA